MKKILLETLNIASEEVHAWQKFFKDSTISQVLLKSFVETFQMLTERNTHFSHIFVKFTAILRKTVTIFFGRNTPNNKVLDVTNKETKKMT